MPVKSTARRKLRQPTKRRPDAAEPRMLTPKDFKARDPNAGLEELQIDPATESAARRYLADNCMGYVRPADRRETVEKHCRALHRLGMPREWTEGWLQNIYDPHGTAEIANNIEEFYRRADLLSGTATSADSDPFERFEGKSLEYFDSLPVLKWLWDDVIAENSLFVLYGRQKSGKTFLALNLALAIAANRGEFCGRKIRWGRVLYIIAEGNEREFKARLKVWIDSFPKSERETIREYLKLNFKAVTCPVMVNQAEHVAALVRKNPGQWDLVVIDTYLRNTSGNVNDPKDAVLFVNGCDTIRRESNAAVMAVHHSGKDESRGAFGSMHLMGACDGAAVVSRQGNGERVMSIDIMRNGDDGQDDTIFKLEAVLVGIDDDGKEHLSCRVDFIGTRPKGSNSQDTDEESDPEGDILKAILVSNPESVEALAGLVEVSKSTVERHMRRLRDKGLMGRGLKLTEEGRVEAQNMLNEDDLEGVDFG